MTLLLREIDVIDTLGDPDGVDVLAVEHDSRRAQPGTLFCCLPGRTTDGHNHAAAAVARGAVGLVCERPVELPAGSEVVQALVPPGTSRASMGRLAAAFWGHPGRALQLVGVTGTNAKTTVAHLVGEVAAHAGLPTRVVGTLSGPRTTPEPTELQSVLAAVRDANPPIPRPVVAMEVSSHALVQSRVEGLTFAVAVFTNLSHEHLDFHGTMEDYFAAKALLFEPGRAARAVVNVDDPWGRRLADRALVPTVAVTAAQATGVQLEAGRSRFIWRGQAVTLAMTGMLNVHNALLAAEAAVCLGLAPGEVAAGLSAATPVPGRLEPVGAPGPGRPFEVLVDFAHTPAALEGVLTEGRRRAAPASGRVLVVFGCGGERDRAKRPLMGAVAGRLADVAVVTSDNPRHEDPLAIVGDVVAGMEGAAGMEGDVVAGMEGAAGPSAAGAELVVEPDRRRAIERALELARPGDVVVLAGKGHETYQQVGDTSWPFDDRSVAAEVLRGLGRRPAGDR